MCQICDIAFSPFQLLRLQQPLAVSETVPVTESMQHNPYLSLPMSSQAAPGQPAPGSVVADMRAGIPAAPPPATPLSPDEARSLRLRLADGWLSATLQSLEECVRAVQNARHQLSTEIMPPPSPPAPAVPLVTVNVSSNLSNGTSPAASTEGMSKGMSKGTMPAATSAIASNMSKGSSSMSTGMMTAAKSRPPSSDSSSSHSSDHGRDHRDASSSDTTPRSVLPATPGSTPREPSSPRIILPKPAPRNKRPGADINVLEYEDAHHARRTRNNEEPADDARGTADNNDDHHRSLNNNGNGGSDYDDHGRSAIGRRYWNANTGKYEWWQVSTS